MQQIILNNLQSGFPADENFARMVAEHGNLIKELCSSLYGEDTVILSGLNVTTQGGGGAIFTIINSGYVWMRGDLVRVDRKVIAGDVPATKIWIGIKPHTVSGTYHSGEYLPTYTNTNGQIVISDNAGSTFRRISDAKRATGIVGDRWSLTGSGFPGALSINIEAIKIGNKVTLSGIIRVLLYKAYDSWMEVCSIAVSGAPSVGTKKVMFPCPVEIVQGGGDNVADNLTVGIIEKTTDGKLRLLVKHEQLTPRVNSGTQAIAHVNITYFI